MKTEITTPISDFLRDYAASGISRFHMPGHKGTDWCHEDAGCAIFSHDITEVKGADSLYEASGIIRESEENAALLFGSAATYYSTEGSSQCIRAMLALAASFGKRSSGGHPPLILAARNVHRSFLTAAALLDLEVQWLWPEDEYSLYSCPVDASFLEETIRSMPRKPDAVYITSPDYLGNMKDIRAISEIAHKHDVLLLVDNAHGSYLHFLKTPLHPIDLGADMCCDSAHKTLPALTGCAYLHLSRRFAELPGSPDPSMVRRALSLFGSTSPSYLLLESLDRTNLILASGWKEQQDHCIRQAMICKKELRRMGWQILGTDIDSCKDPQFSGASEPLKITICAGACGYTGTDLADILRKGQIECEHADPDYLVLMISPSNTQKDFDRLLHVMESIPCPAPAGSIAVPFHSEGIHPETVMSIREAFFAAHETVPVKKAVGRVCADPAIACPPAIPLVVCGERIPEEAIPIFRHYGIFHIEVVKN